MENYTTFQEISSFFSLYDKIKIKCTYKWEEPTVLTPFRIVISYVLSHRSCRNNSNALAAKSCALETWTLDELEQNVDNHKKLYRYRKTNCKRDKLAEMESQIWVYYSNLHAN